MLQIFIVFGICLLGEILSKLIPINFPSSVLSMIILIIMLVLKIIKIEHIKEKTDFLLKNMAFFFIPAGVSIIDNIEYLKGNIINIFIISLLTLILTFLATAYTIKLVIYLQSKGVKKNNE